MCSPHSARWRCAAASSNGGPGEHLDLSMLEAMTLMQSSEWLHSQLLQVPPITRTVEVPSIEPAKDGYVGITMVTGQQWLDFAAMVDCPELDRDPPAAFPDRPLGIPRLDPANGSAPGCANALSTRSSSSASCSGCRSRRWATARRSATWPTCASAGCSCATPPASISPARPG